MMTNLGCLCGLGERSGPMDVLDILPSMPGYVELYNNAVVLMRSVIGEVPTRQATIQGLGGSGEGDSALEDYLITAGKAWVASHISSYAVDTPEYRAAVLKSMDASLEGQAHLDAVTNRFRVSGALIKMNEALNVPANREIVKAEVAKAAANYKAADKNVPPADGPGGSGLGLDNTTLMLIGGAAVLLLVMMNKK